MCGVWYNVAVKQPVYHHTNSLIRGMMLLPRWKAKQIMLATSRIFNELN